MKFITIAMATMTVVLGGCQSATTSSSPETYSAVADPHVKAVLMEQDRQTARAKSSISNRCELKWGYDPSMVAYCEKTQNHAMRGYIIMKTTHVDLVRQGKGSKAAVARYRRCEIDYPADYEMATACVENQEVIDRRLGNY